MIAGAPQQAAEAARAYAAGWALLRKILVAGEFNKSDPRAGATRDSWDAAQDALGGAASVAATPTQQAAYLTQQARVRLSLAWSCRLLGEAKGWAADTIDALDLAASRDPAEASAWGAAWIRQRAVRILSFSGADSDLAPKWGPSFTEPPSGGAGWLAAAIAGAFYWWAKS